MTDAAQPTQPGTRSSVLYALGKLEALVAAQGDVLRGLPAEIMAVLTPRLTYLETLSKDHEGRLRVLERRFWVATGGGLLLVTAVGWWVEYHKG